MAEPRKRAGQRRRTGIEFAAFYSPTSEIVIDADLAWSHARFTEFDPAGDCIPNAVESVASIGVAYNRPFGFFGGVRLRYFRHPLPPR
jgi:hypothetical protein